MPNDMAGLEGPLETVAVKVPRHLVERIEAHEKRMQHSARGVSINRSDAIRSILLLGLESAENAR